MGEVKFARDQLRSLVERVERVEEEIKALNDDKRDIYAEAKAGGFDVRALKAVISYRRKDLAQAEEQDAIFRLYLDTLQGKSQSGTQSATRVRAHETAEPVPQKPVEPICAPVAVTPYPVLEMSDLPPFLDRSAAQ
jgi:uncharacterized protein (UPF0335 family)